MIEIMEIKKNNSEGKDWPQIVAICIASMAAFSCGLLFSWPSPSTLKITQDSAYNISLDEASYFTVIPPISMICCSLLYSEVADRIGPKKTLLLITIPHLIAWLLISLAKSVEVFYISRVFNGIGDGCLFASGPTYIAEIATPKVRDTWGNTLVFSIYLGQFMINVIGSYTSIGVTSYICMCFPVLFVILLSFMPDSPYYLIKKKDMEGARKSLQILRRKVDVEEELLSLKADVDRQLSEKGTWKDVFTIPSNRKAVFNGTFLRASQQFAGFATFAVYTQFIFSKSGGNLSPQISSIIFTGLVCGLNPFAAFALDRLGRRKSYLASLLLCGVVLFVEATYFYLDDFVDSVDISFLNWIPITGMVFYCLFFSFGLAIVPTLMLGELFSASIKGKGLCLMNVVFGLLVFGMNGLFHLLQSNFGLFLPFLFYSICCFINSAMAMFFVEETKGKTLEEIQQSFKNSKTKK